MSDDDRRERQIDAAYGNAAIENPRITRELVAKAYDRIYSRCVCGKTRLQHETQWPACKGFREAKKA